MFSFAHRKRQTPGEEEHSRYKQRDQGLSKPLNGDSKHTVSNRRHLRIHKGSISLKVSRNPRNYNESDLGSRRDRLTLSGGIKIKMFFCHYVGVHSECVRELSTRFWQRQGQVFSINRELHWARAPKAIARDRNHKQ